MLFIGTFFICLFIFMMQFLWRYVDELVGKGTILLLFCSDLNTFVPTFGNFISCLNDIR